MKFVLYWSAVTLSLIAAALILTLPDYILKLNLIYGAF
jgi:hypothetical protein